MAQVKLPRLLVVYTDPIGLRHVGVCAIYSETTATVDPIWVLLQLHWQQPAVCIARPQYEVLLVEAVTLTKQGHKSPKENNE